MVVASASELVAVSGVVEVSERVSVSVDVPSDSGVHPAKTTKKVIRAMMTRM